MLAFIDAVHFVEYFLAAEQTGQFFPEKSGRPEFWVRSGRSLEFWVRSFGYFHTLVDHKVTFFDTMSEEECYSSKVITNIPHY